MIGVLAIPEAVRNKANALGQQAWLGSLPGIVAAIARDWSLTIGRAFPDGTEALVLEAMPVDGPPAVLKLALPGRSDAVRHEIVTLDLAGGRGCARLLRADVNAGALLLERLGPSLHDLALPIGRRHEILCDLAQLIWRPAAGCELPSGAAKARQLAEQIPAEWEALGRPCTERAIDDALASAARREAAHDEERALLVHGDVHEWNALAAGDGFKLVDPDGLLAEPEYDLGVMMREDPVELTRGDPTARARWLAARTGRDERAIWEWGVVERVSTGLLAERIGLQPVGRQMLAAADRVARSVTVSDGRCMLR